MNETLQILLELQHIDRRLKDLNDPVERKQMDEMGFKFDPDNEAKLEKLWKNRAAQLDGEILEHYKLLMQRYGQAIVPMDQGICLGCFMALPTAQLQIVQQNQNVKTCTHCGRILYSIG